MFCACQSCFVAYNERNHRKLAMTTYFILDRHSNTWSDNHYPLSNILATPGITEGHILANARTRQTLTVAQARTLSQTSAKAASKPISARPATGKLPAVGTTASQSKAQNKPGAYMSLSAIPKRADRKYKVISQNDNLFNGQFSAQKLNNILNNHAQQGWRVINCTTVPTCDAQGYERHELLILLEKAAD